MRFSQGDLHKLSCRGLTPRLLINVSSSFQLPDEQCWMWICFYSRFYSCSWGRVTRKTSFENNFADFDYSEARA
jgi:hypothetical protein